MNEENGMFFCLQKIKDKYLKNSEYQKVIHKKADTLEEKQEKIRIMTIMMEMNISENKELMNWSETYENILKDKNYQIALKDKQIKKYQDQLLDAMKKNEDLSIYTRKLANQYSEVANSIKDKAQLNNYQQFAIEGKLHAVEGQLSYLRTDFLSKLKNEETFKKQSKKKRQKGSIVGKNENKIDKYQKTTGKISRSTSSIVKNKKALASSNF